MKNDFSSSFVSAVLICKENRDEFAKLFEGKYFFNEDAAKILVAISEADAPENDPFFERVIRIAQLEYDDSWKISSVLVDSYGKDRTIDLLVKCQRFDFLISSGYHEDMIEQHKYWEEFCEINLKKKQINDLIYEHGGREFLIERQDYRTLARYDEAEILAEFQCWEIMAEFGYDDCWNYLYNNKMKDLLVRIGIKKCRDDFFQFLLKKEEYELLSSDELWKNVHWRDAATDALIGILICIAKRKERIDLLLIEKILASYGCFEKGENNPFAKFSDEVIVFLYQRSRECRCGLGGRNALRKRYAWKPLWFKMGFGKCPKDYPIIKSC